MKFKLYSFIIFAIFFLGCIIYVLSLPEGNNNKFILADIKIEVKGKIKKKVAVRKDLLTHAKISRYKKSDTLVFLGENIDNVKIGDSIVKNKNSPFIYVLKDGKQTLKLNYVLIPKSLLNEKDFPKAWKDSCKNSWRSAIIDY